MAQQDLESLLFRIRDGVASDAEIVRARELVETDERLPEELREVVDFTDDPDGDAVGLLAVLGADSLFGDLLREGLADEIASVVEVSEPGAPVAGGLAITEADLEEPWPWSEPLAAAVRAEAGACEVAASVLSELGLEEPIVPLAEAVRALAGEVELSADVLAHLGLPAFELPLARAVSGEAGEVDLVQQVEAELTDLGLPLAEAIRFEAGEVEIVAHVLERLGGEAGLPVAEAVREEAGGVQLWDELEPIVSGAWVSAMLDHELSSAGHRAAARRLHDDQQAREQMTAFAMIGSELRSALAEEAGEAPYIWEGVARTLGMEPERVEGWDGEAFAAAVRAEAGEVDVTEGVLARVGAQRRMPSSLEEPDELPTPANVGFSLGAVLAIAMAALLFFAGPNLRMQGGIGEGPNPVAQIADDAQFASAGEIVVEELDYYDDSNVHQVTGDDGALILWVDEGTTL